MAPDSEHSRKVHTRLLHRHRPAQFFTAYEKDEFVAPDGETFLLMEMLLTQTKPGAVSDSFGPNAYSSDGTL